MITNTMIFLAGLFVSTLVVCGLIFTVLEFRRIERDGPQPRNDRFPL